MRKLIDYLYPRRKLWRVPKSVTAAYERGNMTKSQAIFLLCGLARDPDEAQAMVEDYQERYGLEMWNYVHMEVKRKRTETVKERIMKLLRKIAGENEYIPTRRRSNDAIVTMDFVYQDLTKY